MLASVDMYSVLMCAMCACLSMPTYMSLFLYVQVFAEVKSVFEALN